MEGPTTHSEQMKVPADLKELREHTVALLSDDKGKRWLAKMKEYFIMNRPVALSDYKESYCYFREGQNSILRAIEMFVSDENVYNQWLDNQMKNGGK